MDFQLRCAQTVRLRCIGRLQARDQNRATSFFSRSKKTPTSDTGTHRSKRPLIFCVNRKGISSPLFTYRHADAGCFRKKTLLSSSFPFRIVTLGPPTASTPVFYLGSCTRHFPPGSPLLFQDKILNEHVR